MPPACQFPILSRQVNGKPLVYLDNAASAQKPRAVIEAMTAAMEGPMPTSIAACIRWPTKPPRPMSARAGDGGGLPECGEDEIVFTKGGTEAINLVANSFGQSVQPGDEIVVTQMEHHANIVPWHMLRERKGAVLRFARS
jgi:cysteine desulfurase/selenocysteine lyase